MFKTYTVCCQSFHSTICFAIRFLFPLSASKLFWVFHACGCLAGSNLGLVCRCLEGAFSRYARFPFARCDHRGDGLQRTALHQIVIAIVLDHRNLKILRRHLATNTCSLLGSLLVVLDLHRKGSLLAFWLLYYVAPNDMPLETLVFNRPNSAGSFEQPSSDALTLSC